MDPRACDGRTTVCPLWLLGSLCEALETRAIEFLHYELLGVDAVQATHIEHHHVFAARALAVSVGLDAAGLAELMMNRVLVELVLGHFILARHQFEVRHCNG